MTERREDGPRERAHGGLWRCLAGALAVIAAAPAAVHGADDARALAGAAGGTTFRAGGDAFSAPLPALEAEALRRFAAGRRLFRTVWRPEAVGADAAAVGLGPLFNRNACSGCHVRDGRGRPPEADGGPARGMVVRLSPSRTAYGVQLQDQAVVGLAYEGRIAIDYDERAERLADGTVVRLRVPSYRIAAPGYGPADALHLSPRVPPAVHGAGLLEAVDGRALRALADPEDSDGDGISGRLAELTRDGQRVIGRFGWKATRASLAEQVIDAAADDIGLASAGRPDGGCSPAQRATIAACRQPTEITGDEVADLVAYLRALAVPARRGLDRAEVARGEAVFAAAGCADCHRPTLPLGEAAPAPALTGATIRPYTDLLLHDMGAGLADQAGDGAAEGPEWRTPPLWGIGLVETINGHTNFLHDGRARSLLEAVLWHGGEAAAAREAVRALSPADRDALLAFLRSL